MKFKITQFQAFLLVIIIILLLVAGCEMPKAKEKTINIIFRYDDFSELSNTPVDIALLQIFESYNAPLTVGIIPFVVPNAEEASPQETFPLSQSKADLLKPGLQDGTITLALHGFSHQTHTPRPFREFAGLNLRDQEDKLAKGRAYLEDLFGAPISVFIPPWNRFDQNTENALQDQGFSIVSGASSAEFLDGSSLHIAPVSCLLRDPRHCVVEIPATCTLHTLKRCLQSAKKTAFQKPTIVVLLHSYDFKESGAKDAFFTFSELSDLFKWLYLQSNVKIISMQEMIEPVPDLTVSDYFGIQSVGQ